MKTLLLSLFLLVNALQLFSQKSPAPRFDGVYFTKPWRHDSLDVWSVRCLRFYPDKTVILTTEIYPDEGFDMSRFGNYFSKEHLPPETARGKYAFRNDSLVFSTEAYFKGETKRHTIRNRYRLLKSTSDTLWLERENEYAITPDTSKFYFRRFLKSNQD